MAPKDRKSKKSGSKGGADDVDALAAGMKAAAIVDNGRSCTGVLSSHPESRDVLITSFTLLYHGHQLLVDAELQLNFGRWDPCSLHGGSLPALCSVLCMAAWHLCALCPHGCLAPAWHARDPVLPASQESQRSGMCHVAVVCGRMPPVFGGSPCGAFPNQCGASPNPCGASPSPCGASLVPAPCPCGPSPLPALPPGCMSHHVGGRVMPHPSCAHCPLPPLQAVRPAGTQRLR